MLFPLKILISQQVLDMLSSAFCIGFLSEFELMCVCKVCGCSEPAASSKFQIASGSMNHRASQFGFERFCKPYPI